MVLLLSVACIKSSGGPEGGNSNVENSSSSSPSPVPQEKVLKEVALFAEITFGAKLRSAEKPYFWPDQIETLGCHYFNVMREANAHRLEFIRNKLPIVCESDAIMCSRLQASLDNYTKKDRECHEQCPKSNILTCMINYCSHAAGIWDRRRAECVCPIGQIFSSKDGGSCLPYHARTLLNGNLSIELDDMNFFSLQKDDLVGLEELNFSKVLYFNPTSSLFSSNFFVNFSREKEKLVSQLQHLSTQVPLANYILQDSYQSFGKTYLFPPMRPVQLENRNRNLLQLPVPENQWVAPLLGFLELLQKDDIDLSEFSLKPGITSPSDCILYCGLVFKLSENVHLTRFYSRGKVYFQTLDYLDKNDISRARFFINPLDQLIAVQTLIIQGRTETVAKFYDRELVPLYSFLQELPQKHRATPIPEIKRDTVIACGDIYDDWYNQILGPEDNSLSGWIKNTDNSLLLYADGFRNYTLSGFDITQTAIDHGRAVHAILESSLDRPNIVMSSLSCFNPDRWSSYLLQAPHSSYPLVRNLSFGIYSSPENCAAWNGNNEFYKEHHLWVMGAGNVLPGSPHSQFFKHRSCLQMMASKINSLIVAATDENQKIASYSVKGPEYADVAISGTTLYQGKKLEGTSFATPKVSRLAADLSARYSELAERGFIRYLIMLSPKLKDEGDHFKFLPVRSGGIVDSKKAFELAELVAKLSFHEQDKLISALDTRKSPNIIGERNKIAEELVLKIHCQSQRCRKKLQKEYIDGWLRLAPVGLLP